ncbi:MAG: beta-N-acetylhexosaminidase, partial [Bradymonadaceae bacterium]
MHNIRQAVGQLLLVGFPGADPEPPPSVTAALEAGEIGGVILFRRNVADVDQVAALNAAVHHAARGAIASPFVAVDQEGGRVVRLREPLTPLPTMRAAGAKNDPDLVVRLSEVIATELSALGFNLNFAPVLDVDTNPDNPVIGDRAFATTPERVARYGGAFLIGHLMAGVVPCGKHFPGHGDTLVDSHLGLPRLMHDMERLDEIELLPFRMAVQAGIPMIMTAHISLPALDAFHPATMSRKIIGDLLREDIGYDGIVITDCLEMKAVSEQYEIEEMVELSLMAGVDIFLICHTEEKWKRAFEHLCALAEKDDAARERIFESARRVQKLKEDFWGKLPRPWQPIEGWRE